MSGPHHPRPGPGHVLHMLTLLLALAAFGCAGDDGLDGLDGSQGPEGTTGAQGPQGPTGPTGPAGRPGNSGDDADLLVLVEGEVFNQLTQEPIQGAIIRIDPFDAPRETDADGRFSYLLPIGVYDFTIEAEHFAPVALESTLVAFWNDSMKVGLEPLARVVVDAGSDLTAIPNSTVAFGATVEIFDGSEVVSYAWEQVDGPVINLNGARLAEPWATLPPLAAYKIELAGELEAPDRFMVLGIDPHALETATISTLEVQVYTTSGLYKDRVEIHADTGLRTGLGIRNVPVGLPVLLQAREASNYEWIVELAPVGAKVALDEPGSRWPMFTPDMTGLYRLRETASNQALVIAAGKWFGGITGLDAAGRPEMGECTGCHNGNIAPNDQFETWKLSGHAEIFNQNIDNPTHHWSMGCASCHTVGFDLEVDNDGFDDWAIAEQWTVPAGAPGNYAAMLAKGSGFQNTAALANIQCDNCHGPSHGPAHGGDASLRISYASTLCGSCHGEPPRHGRYQQWKQSGHADLELAIEDATVEARGESAGHCGRCHSTQGFIAWIKQGDLTKTLQGAAGNANVEELTKLGLTVDNIEAVACVACHDAHYVGTVSGEPNDVRLRVMNSTGMLPSGFEVSFAGKGALCMACHNSRNGLHNDFVPAPSSLSAPHGSSQADVFLGENAYFVLPGFRSGHAFIQDTCSSCHLVRSPPPEAFSLAGAGTNHGFKANLEGCGDCHGDFDGGNIVQTFDLALEELRLKLAHDAAVALNELDAVWVRAIDAETGLYSSTRTTDSNVRVDLALNPVEHADLLVGHGQLELHLVFEHAILISWTDGTSTETREFSVQLRSLLSDRDAQPSDAVITGASDFYKAAWNYVLLNNDGSHGIHNAAWAMEVIRASLVRDLTF